MSLTASSPHVPLLQAPLAYRIGLALIRRRWRGSSLLFDRLVRPGLAQQVVRYRRPDLRPDPQQPLFDQLRPARICNIICRSTR